MRLLSWTSSAIAAVHFSDPTDTTTCTPAPSAIPRISLWDDGHRLRGRAGNLDNMHHRVMTIPCDVVLCGRDQQHVESLMVRRTGCWYP